MIDNNIYFLFDKTSGTITGLKDKKDFQKIDIPQKIEGTPVLTIGNKAFQGCDKLTSVTIPEGIKTIGNNAFSGCKNLISIYIPQSVKNIEDLAFKDCSKLKDINIYNKDIKWGQNVFHPELTITSNENNLIFAIDSSGINGLTEFGKTLTNIIIPRSQDNAPIIINKGAFRANQNLKIIKLAGSEIIINNEAFAQSNIETIEIDSKTQKLSLTPDAFKGCKMIKSIIIKGNNILNLSSSKAFSDFKNVIFYVPNNMLENYTRNLIWRKYMFKSIAINNPAPICSINLKKSKIDSRKKKIVIATKKEQLADIKIAELISKAGHGDCIAQFKYYKYLIKINQKTDAFEWLRKSAENDNTQALHEMIQYYPNEKTYTIILRIFEKITDKIQKENIKQQLGELSCYLGLQHMENNNQDLAETWLKKAVKWGNEKAKKKLGEFDYNSNPPTAHIMSTMTRGNNSRRPPEPRNFK